MYNRENEKNFTRREENDKINSDKRYTQMASDKPNRTMPDKPNGTLHDKPQLSNQQKENIKSAYNARKGGYISEEQYRDNLSKNGINLPKEKLERERLEALTGQYDLKKLTLKIWIII